MTVNRARISSISHGELPFHNPLDPRRIDELLGLIELGPQDRVLDVGCGAGELLVRIAERHGCAGLGIDDAEIQIAAAREKARQRAPQGALRFEVADARTARPAEAPFALVACIGSMHAAGDGLPAALARLADLAAPGGHVLIGDGFWRRPPDPAYLDALGATEDELPDYAGLMRAGEGAGLEAVYACVTTDEEWDRYEWRLIFNGLRFAAAHPNDPDAAGAAAWARSARERYLAPGGRDTLGFALVLFRAA